MANIHRMTKRKLGEILIHERLVTQEQVQECLLEQAQSGELLGQVLVRKGYCSEKDIAETIATQFSFPYIEPDQYYIASDVLHLLPMEFVDKHSVIPLDRFDDTLVIVVAGPLEDEVLQEIGQLTGCTVQIFVSTVSEVRKAVETLKQGQRRAAARRETYGG